MPITPAIDWRKGPRERILALIESYMDIVLELEEVTGT
jgi:hypothetical protein